MQLTSICQIYSDVGLTAYTAGDLQTAELMLEAGLKEVERQKVNSTAALALMQNLALTYYRQKRQAEAAQVLEKALKMSKQSPVPKQSEIGLSLADLRFELGMTEMAQDLYRRYLLKSADCPLKRGRLKRYAYLLSVAGKHDLARQVVEQLA